MRYAITYTWDRGAIDGDRDYAEAEFRETTFRAKSDEAARAQAVKHRINVKNRVNNCRNFRLKKIDKYGKRIPMKI
jgi:hypothetical protein